METNRALVIIQQELTLFRPGWEQWREREVIGFGKCFDFGVYFIKRKKNSLGQA